MPSEPRFEHVKARALIPWRGRVQDLVIALSPDDNADLIRQIGVQRDAFGEIRVVYIRPSETLPTPDLLEALQVVCEAIAVGQGTIDPHGQFEATVVWRSERMRNGTPVVGDKLVLMVTTDVDVVVDRVIRWRVI